MATAAFADITYVPDRNGLAEPFAVEIEATDDHPPLPVFQAAEGSLNRLGGVVGDGNLLGIGRGVVRQEVPELRRVLAVFADREVDGDRLHGIDSQLPNLGHILLHGGGDLFVGGRVPISRELFHHFVHANDVLLGGRRHTDVVSFFLGVLLDRLENPPPSVGAETKALLDLELVCCLQQTDIPLLNEIFEGKARFAEFLSDRNRQAQIAQDQLVPGTLTTGTAGFHLRRQLGLLLGREHLGAPGKADKHGNIFVVEGIQHQESLS